MQSSSALRATIADAVRETRRAFARHLIAAATSDGSVNDMTFSQFSALMILSEGDEHTVKEMATLLGRSLSATSRLLDQLVRRRLLRRFEDARDRRARRVALGQKGHTLIDTLLTQRAEAQMELMALLSADERSLVERAMSLLAGAARRRRPRG